MPDNNKLYYKIKTASTVDILMHLSDCSESFIPRLESRVNLEQYAKKIAEKSVTFEAWKNNVLIGLIAAYFNDVDRINGYITSVSVSESSKGQGVASALLRQCINYAHENGFKNLSLEVNKLNFMAIKLYEKYNFNKNNQQEDFHIMKLSLAK